MRSKGPEKSRKIRDSSAMHNFLSLSLALTKMILSSFHNGIDRYRLAAFSTRIFPTPLSHFFEFSHINIDLLVTLFKYFQMDNRGADRRRAPIKQTQFD